MTLEQIETGYRLSGKITNYKKTLREIEAGLESDSFSKIQLFRGNENSGFMIPYAGDKSLITYIAQQIILKLRTDIAQAEKELAEL